MGNSVIDLIVRIKNGYMSRREQIDVLYSVFNGNVLQKLADLGFIKKFEKNENVFNVELLYNDHMPAVTDILIYSKPGKRHYVSYKELKPVLGGLGYSLLSTPQGVLTNREARKGKVGGELLFAIW